MKTSIILFLSWAFSLGLWAEPSASPSTPAFQWDSVNIEGTPYISLQQLSQFYHLTEKARSDNRILLENKRLQVKLTIGSQETFINRLKVFLSEPIREKDKQPYLSLLDLTSLIDPIFRPSFITNAKDVNTVILDAGHGGADKGAAHLEAQYALSIIKKNREILTKKGFLTHKEESAKIKTEDYQDTLAKSIVRGIEVYRASIKK